MVGFVVIVAIGCYGGRVLVVGVTLFDGVWIVIVFVGEGSVVAVFYRVRLVLVAEVLFGGVWIVVVLVGFGGVVAIGY